MSRSGSKTKLNSSGSRSSLKEKAKKKGGEAEEVDDAARREEEKEVEQLSWKILGKNETAELAGMEDPHQIAQKLAAVLGLEQYQENLAEAALLDYYVATYWFSREHKFTDEQISTLFTITHTLITKLREHHYSLVEAIQELKELLSGVGVSHKTAVRCLTPEVARLVVECVSTGLFQHYRLFQFLFQEQQIEQNTEISLNIEVLPPASSHDPPHLDEAVSLKLYEMHMAPKPPSPSEEEEQTESQETNVEGVSSALTNLSKDEGEMLMKVPPEKLKALMDSLTSSTLSSYQDEVFSKLQNKEKEFSTRLSKLEKSFT